MLDPDSVNTTVFMLTMLSLAQATSAALDRVARLDRACALVQKAYPMLMLAVMAEGPMECGDPMQGESIDCDANDTPEQGARQAKRLEIRVRQEAVFKRASDACDAWAADRRSQTLQEAALRAYAEAQKVGTDLPPEVRD